MMCKARCYCLGFFFGPYCVCVVFCRSIVPVLWYLWSVLKCVTYASCFAAFHVLYIPTTTPVVSNDNLSICYLSPTSRFKVVQHLLSTQ